MANTGPSDSSITVAMLIFGVVGGLIGFGVSGTFQGACLGAGIGALTPLALLMLGA
jgi:hypothetical protein